MRRTLSQNAILHARLRTWARNIVLLRHDGEIKDDTETHIKVEEKILKGAAKMVGVLTGEARFQNLFSEREGHGTSGLSKSDFGDFFNLMEQKFSEIWPDAYEPIPRDRQWDSEN